MDSNIDVDSSHTGAPVGLTLPGIVQQFHVKDPPESIDGCVFQRIACIMAPGARPAVLP